jgi:asparagine synthase (glutamine-hydrolysing)
MAGLSSQPVKTFSIGFTESDYNELDHARRVARRWSTDHHELVVEPDALSILPLLVRHYGEPYGDSSAIPTFYVSQMTRRDVTVALNGDGGDESFAGYERYLANRLADGLRRLPGSRLAASGLAKVVPDSINQKNRLRQLRRFLTVAHQPMAERYARWVGCFREDGKAGLYAPEFRGQLAAEGREAPPEWMERLFREVGPMDPVDASMAVDVRSYLPFDLLVKVDITSMANSLEGRSPFLDHEVMEFAARLPVHLKLRGKESKYLLKRAFADLLPRENVQRRKMGFGVPVGHWFRGPLREFVCDHLLSARSLGRGYFQPAAVKDLVERHVAGQADHAFQLWYLLMLELWHAEFLDAPRPTAVTAG